MDLIPWAADGLFENTLCGIRMLQTFGDLRLWEWVLSHHPVRTVIELGTGNGGLSVYLALQAHMRGQRFATFDRYECTNLARSPLPIRQIIGDMWTDDVQTQLRALLAEHPVLLFCDGGNKPLEFQTFAPWLAPDDIIGVHDWENEFNPHDADPVRPLIAELLPEEMYAYPGNFTRFFRRR